jgi:heme oxygenase
MNKICPFSNQFNSSFQKTIMKFISAISSVALILSSTTGANAFTIISQRSISSSSSQLNHHPGMGGQTLEATGFIDTELRGAAMKLHTKMQSPKEGKVEDKPKPADVEPYVTTHLDYLKFLVDSQHVYQAFEEIVEMEELSPELNDFINTGLERSQRLEKDIEFISSEYDVERPEVGSLGESYAKHIRDIASKGKEEIPEFMCHFYNYYFAHTAGGRMIGKKMASMLLEKKTLEFYKWDGNVNEIKGTVKASIEKMAAEWSREQKDMCINATMDVFRGGGGINAYLGGHH